MCRVTSIVYCSLSVVGLYGVALVWYVARFKRFGDLEVQLSFFGYKLPLGSFTVWYWTQ